MLLKWLRYTVHRSYERFKNCMDWLLQQMAISHTMSILKILTDLCVKKKKTKVKNTFASIVYNVLLVKTIC